MVNTGLIKLPKQQCSFKTKQTKDWFMNNADYYIRRAISENSSRMSSIKNQYKFLNHDIDSGKYKEVMGTLQKDLDAQKLLEFKTKKQDYNIILKIVKKYVGEYLSNYNRYQVFCEDAEGIMSRNDMLKVKLQDILMQGFINGLNANGFNTGEETKEVPNVQQFIEEESQIYIESRTISAKNRLNLLLQLCDDITKITEAVFEYVVTDNMIFYVYNQDNDTDYEVVPPLEYYPINTSSSGFIEDNQAGVRKYKKTLSDILYEFDEMLTNKQKEDLKEIINRFNNPLYESPQTLSLAEYGGIVFKYESDTRGVVTFTDEHMFTDVYHIQFQSYKKVGRLKYIDFNINELLEKDVSEDYKLDISAGDISVEYRYVPCVYEQYKFGNDDTTGIYLPPMELDVNREHLSRKNEIKLSYYGVTNILKNAPYKPLPERLIDYQIEYEIIRYQRKKTIAKFRPFIQFIPESVLADSDEFTLESRYSKMLEDDTLILNDESLNPQTANILQAGIKSTVEKYIDSLTMILKSIEEEILNESDMSPVRYGNASPYMSRELANMQLNYSTIGNVIASVTYSKVRGNLYEALIDYSKIAWIEGKKGTILNPDGESEIVEVDGIEHYNDNIGIFVKDLAKESQQIERIKQLAERAAQNNNYDLMLEFITNDDIPSLKKTAKALKEADQQFQKEIQGYQAKAEEIKAKVEQQKMKHEMTLEQLKQDGQTQRQNSINQTQLIINGVLNTLNSDDDDNDEVQSNRALQQQKLEQNERKMQSAERIAGMNKN